MTFSWSEDDLAVRHAVRDFVDKEIRPLREQLEHGDLPPYDIMRKYYDTCGLGEAAAEQCWEDYALSMVQGPLVAIFGCAFGEKTERGPRMFAAMVNRACTAIRDLDTLARVG